MQTLAYVFLHVILAKIHEWEVILSPIFTKILKNITKQWQKI